MKKKLLLLSLLAATFFAKAQNVGIGTSTPLQKLHVEGASFLNGNVGIGENTPAFPLSFGPALGDKISLWSNSANSYGFGIQGGLLQIHTDVTTADIAFGYGSSNGFTERARIINNGTDGMMLNGRLHIKNGSTPLNVNETGGVWLYKSDNSDPLSFIGTQNNQNVGFYGGTVNGGWGFVYNAVNSRVGIGTSNPSQIFHVEGTTLLNGNVGIGQATPMFPLSFNGNIGDKISLWADGSATHYGFGIQGGLLQMFSKTVQDDIAFGYGSSNSFTETMRIKGNGNVGIGNNNPVYQLDISNRIRIRSGGNNSVSAGLWLNNNTNAEAAFIGMEDDTHVGFFGLGTGWKFGMNTQTGALKINGTEGTAGQVLQSNGNNAPTWTSSTNTLFNNTGLSNSTTLFEISQPMPPTAIPGLSYTFSVTGNAKVLVSFNLHVYALICSFCGPSDAVIEMHLNSSRVASYSFFIANASVSFASGSQLFSVGAGTHTIQLLGDLYQGPNITFYPNTAVKTNNMIVQVIPQ